MQITWFTKIILNDVVPSKEIFESSFRIAIEDDIAIPHRICSMKNTSSCGAILFKKIIFLLLVMAKVTINKQNHDFVG